MFPAFSSASECGSAHGGVFNRGSLNNNNPNLCSSGAKLTQGLREKKLLDSDFVFQWGCGKDSCFAYIKVDGLCGTANGKKYTSFPTSGLCASGNDYVTRDNNAFSWNCQGVNGGSTVSCSAINAKPPKCGRYDQSVFSTEYQDLCFKKVDDGYTFFCDSNDDDISYGNYFCDEGVPLATDVQYSIYDGRSNLSWYCVKELNGELVKSSQCNARIKIAGKCNTPEVVKAVGHICKQGVLVKLVKLGNTSYWSCHGSDGFEVCIDNSSTQINGVCGPSHGASFTSKPTSGLCNAGTPTSVSGSGPWSWRCSGSNGGSTVSCSAKKTSVIVNGVCGPSNGASFTSKPKSGLCNAGTPTSVSGSGPWSWICRGGVGGSSVVCRAEKMVSGEVSCGSDNGKKLSSFPSSNVCVNGRLDGYGSYGSSGPWVWVCTDDKGKRVTCRL